MWPFEKKQEVTKNLENRVELIIHLKNQSRIIGVNCLINKEKAIEKCGEGCWRNYVFIPFLQWWYDTNKPYYALRHRDGEDMVKRTQVESFHIRDANND